MKSQRIISNCFKDIQHSYTVLRCTLGDSCGKTKLIKKKTKELSRRQFSFLLLLAISFTGGN